MCRQQSSLGTRVGVESSGQPVYHEGNNKRAGTSLGAMATTGEWLNSVTLRVTMAMMPAAWAQAICTSSSKSGPANVRAVAIIASVSGRSWKLSTHLVTACRACCTPTSLRQM